MNDTINFTSSVPTGASAQVGGATEFVKAVARYYRDFLETDFKKANVPTRQVRVRLAILLAKSGEFYRLLQAEW